MVLSTRLQAVNTTQYTAEKILPTRRYCEKYQGSRIPKEIKLQRACVFLRCGDHPISPDRLPALNPAARHDAPAAPARFMGCKLREGRKVQSASRTGFAAKIGRYKNYEKLRGNFQIGDYDELGDFLGDSKL